MDWLFLTILAICSRSLMSVAVKLLSNRAKISPITQAVLFTGAATGLSVLISPFIGGISFNGLSGLWLITVLMISAQAGGNILFFKGLATLEASVAAIAFSSLLLWGSILSIAFLDSSFSYQQIAGIALLFLAILLVQYKKGVKRIEPAILYILSSALLFAIFQVSSAELSKTMPAGTYLLLSFGGATLIVWLAYIKQVHKDFKTILKHKTSVAQATVFASTCSMGYFVFSYFAYRNAPDRGVVVVLLTSQVILSVILGIIFLKEYGQIKRKLTAGVLAVIAGILIKS